MLLKYSISIKHFVDVQALHNNAVFAPLLYD